MTRRVPLNEFDPLNQEILERPRRAGRQPTRPQKLAQRMQQLIKETKQWARRCEEVWFGSDGTMIETARGASDPKRLLKQYDEAIQAFQEAAKWAAVGRRQLANGRKRVQVELAAAKRQTSTKGKKQK